MKRNKLPGKMRLLFFCCVLVPATAVFSCGGTASLPRPDPGTYAPAALPLKGYTIALNAGHARATNALVPYNGDGAGTFSAEGKRLIRYPGNPLAIKSGEWEGVLRESDLNKDIVARLDRHLDALGARVNKIRIESTETTLWGQRNNLYARILRANRSRAALLLDIHLNSGHPGMKGFTIFISSTREQLTNFAPGKNFVLFNEKKHTPFNDRRLDASLECARSIHNAFTNTARGVNPILPYRTGTIFISRFFVVARAGMPAVLVECGFMNTEADMDHLASAEYRENLAERLCDAICEYIAASRSAPRVPRARGAPALTGGKARRV